MPTLNRNTHWRKTWTVIVPGRFGGAGPYSDLLFYDPTDGVAEFYSTDGQGNITLLTSYDWGNDWDLIVPGNFGGTANTGQTDILRYSRASGTASFLAVQGQGNVNPLNSEDWNNDWDLIVPGDFGGMATTGQSDIFLYNRASGAGGFFDVWGSGNTNPMRSCDDGSIRCDLIVPGNFGTPAQSQDTHLCLWRRDHGDLKFYRVKSRGLLAHIRSFDNFKRHVAIIVPGYFSKDGRVTDLLFYDRDHGVGEFYVAYDPPNSVQQENAAPGSDSWKLTSPATNHEIEGYASAASVDRGNLIAVHVNTEAPTYSMEFFGMGVYQGLGARSMRHETRLRGIRQATILCDGDLAMPSCAWTPTFSLKIPDSWRSGVYLIKLTSDPYTVNGTAVPSFDQYIVFVVRDDASSSDILFQTSVNTYQAYNVWGGTSLYGDTKDGGDFESRGYGASFNRPYGSGSGFGCSDFLVWEYPMLRWLENSGYDVTYSTDVDTDARGELLLNHKAFLSVGHDEYWSLPMRGAVEAAVASGVSAAFFGANAIFWQVRLYASTCDANADVASATGVSSAAGAGAANSAVTAASVMLEGYWTSRRRGVHTNDPRVIVCYKDATIDPLNGIENHRVTVNWRNDPVARPEDALIGQMWESWYPTGNFAWVAVNTNLWPFQGTGINEGDAFPGIVGYEYDRIFDGTEPMNLEGNPPQHTAYPNPPGLLVLGRSPVETHNNEGVLVQSVSNSTLYTAPSGAIVFSAGTISWSWGLADDVLGFFPPWNNHQYSDPRLQMLTSNLLNRMIG